MSFLSWLFLDVISALVSYWWVWGILIILQVVLLLFSDAWWRGLPSWLLLAGFLAALAWPLLRR